MSADVLLEVFPAPLVGPLGQEVELLSDAPFTTLEEVEPRLLAEAEILVTSWGAAQVDSGFVAAAPRLRAVFHAAGSVKGFLHEAAWEAGIRVSSGARIGAMPVVEYTMAMIALASHRVLPLASAYRREGFPPVRGRRGRADLTVGVVGASLIGSEVIRRLVADGWGVAAYDPVAGPEGLTRLGAVPLELDELCRRSDILTLHAPSIPETRWMIDDRRLGLLRDGATLINSARGSLVEQSALERHCAAGRIDAVLDVTDPEPLPADSALLRLPNVFVSPHAAGIQGSEIARLGEFVLEEIRRYRLGDPLRGEVSHQVLSTLA